MTYLSECPKSRHTDNIKCWWVQSNRNFHSLLVGMVSGTVTLERGLVVSYKTNHILTLQSSHHAPIYSNKLKIYVHTEYYTQAFTEAGAWGGGEEGEGERKGEGREEIFPQCKVRNTMSKIKEAKTNLSWLQRLC